MKALQIVEEALVWSEVPTPQIKDDEVLIAVEAAGVNRADVLQVAGKYPPPPGCPEWPGLEVAGRIVEVGKNARRWQVGDEVCALLGGGGYAEFVAVKDDMCLPLPKGFSMEEAAGLLEVFATSWLDLVHEGELKAGETAYIPAGASGLAGAAIPLAKGLGARVITSVLSEEKAKEIAHLGADRILVNEPFPEEESIDVAMDCLAGPVLAEGLAHMNRGGRWILISTLAGVISEIPLRAVLTKGLKLKGSTLRSRAPEFKAQILAQLEERVWPMLESGVIRPHVDRVFPMPEAAQAHEIMKAGKHTGKMILKV